MPWKPIQPKHAIERVRIAAAFSQKIPDRATQKASEIFEAHRKELGFSNRTNLDEAILSMQLGPSGLQPIPQPAPPQQARGWRYLRTRNDGRPIETLELVGDALAYDTTEYGRWSLVKERAQSVFGDVAAYLSDIASRRATIITYADRFVFEGKPEKADVTELLGPLAELIGEEARTGAKLWHINRGWFETVEDRDVLLNINLAAQDGRMRDGRQMRSIELLTTVEIRHDPNKGAEGNLFDDLEVLHTVALRAFGEAINKNARKLVGLE